VQAAKLALVGAATVVALIAAVAVPEFRADPSFAAFGWAIAALTGLTPAWFFLGVERLRTLAYVDVTVRLVMAAAIVLFVTEEGHGLRVLWIWTLGSVVSLSILSALMYRRVRFERPSRAGGLLALREGWPLFVTTASVSLYTSGTVFMLGLVTTSARLAMFAAAERVARVALRAISPVSAAAYPRVSHLLASGRPDRAQQLSVVVLAAVTGAAVLTTAVLWVSAPTVVRLLFGERFADAAGLIRVIALILPCVAVTSSLSGLWLLTRGLDRPSTIIAVAGAVSSVALTPLIGTLAGPRGVAWLMVAVEVVMAVAFVIVVRAKGLAPTRAQLQNR
jgi:PST family polysaccharide transporter